MTWLAEIGSALGRLFLLPGNLACNALKIGDADNRDLVRVFVNSLAWTLAAVTVVAITV
jgi:hypothetical protein